MFFKNIKLATHKFEKCVRYMMKNVNNTCQEQLEVKNYSVKRAMDTHLDI